MENPNIYPWMQDQWRHVLQQYQSDRLPHALLLSGPSGLGKLHFAKQLVSALQCDGNRNYKNQEIKPPCGKCNGCQLIVAGTHPDNKFVEPEAEGKQIPVATIREISQFFSLKSQFAPLQIVVISPAEAMNRHSANGLLKTLEEPQSNKLILLLSSQPSRLLPTVKSRCQHLNFSIPETDQGMAWLQSQNAELRDKQSVQRLLTLAGGAPLLAFQYAEQGKLELYQQLLDSFEKLAKKQVDPVAEAKRWEAAGLAHCVKWLYLWVSSVIHLKSGGAVVDTTFGDQKMGENNAVWREPSLDFLADKTSSDNLYGFLDQLVETSRVVNTTVNVQLTLESLLMGWCQRIK